MAEPSIRGRFVRVAIAVTALAAVLTAILASFLLPARSGDWGVQKVRNARGFQILRTLADGPAAKAGIRPGDEIVLDRMPMDDRVAVAEPIAGVPVQVTVERHGQIIPIALTPAPRSPYDSTFNFWTFLVFSLVYALVALLVALKAPPTAATAAILAVITGIAFNDACNSFTLVMTTSYAAAAASIAGQLFVISIVFGQFSLPLVFPPRRTRTLRVVALAGIPVTLAYVGVYEWHQITRVLGGADVGTLIAWLTIAFGLVVTAGVIDSVRSSSRDIRPQAGWAAFGVLIPVYLFAIGAVLTLLGWDRGSWQNSTEILDYASGLAIAYAVLRHRLGGLELIISRAATFSVVSLLLVAAFVLGEWGVAVILERSFGGRFGAGGQTIFAALIALAVGLSARTIHDVVSYRLNRLFFAKRYRSLEALHRFSLETDSAIETAAVAKLAFTMLKRHLEAQYVAIYRGCPEDGYAMLHGAAGSPEHLAADDELVLRLRRWSEAFVNDEHTEFFRGAYLCPMTLRGSLRGFVACGPKRDHAAYLPDERDVLSTLAHRVGIALEWLTRPAIAGERDFTLPARP